MTLPVRLTVWIFLATTAACSGKIEHDLDLAAKRAMEFADTTFVRHDLEKGYNLLADKTRAYVPFGKFKESIATTPCGDHPAKVTVDGVAPPIADENMVNVVLRFEGAAGCSYRMTVTLAGTAVTDYRVITLDGGGVP